jgi:hypothetical protein
VEERVRASLLGREVALIGQAAAAGRWGEEYATQTSSRELYRGGLHRSFWEMEDTATEKVVALAILKLNGPIHKRDSIDDIRLCPDDKRVAVIGTCHGYYALAQKVGKYPVGTCFGDEDEGVDEKWQEILGWATEWTKD